MSDEETLEVKGYTSPYFAAHMINLEWVQHRSGVHSMVPASVNIKDSDGNLLVTSYAVHRPDGNWSLMLVNRDESNPHTVRVVFEDAKSKTGRIFFGSGHLGDFRQRAICLDQRRTRTVMLILTIRRRRPP